jgi:exodeoxyribonuclease III
MRIATWNVNSIRARSARLSAWLDRDRPDVVCLQETKVEDAGFPRELFAERGYHVAFHGQKSYNGVAIAARTPLSAVTTGFGDRALDEQARLIAATVDGVRVVSLYVPNGGDLESDKYPYKLAWLAGLRRWLDRHDRATPLVLGGDWNIAPGDRDVHDPERWRGQVLCSDRERDALQLIADWGVTDVYRSLYPDGGGFSWWDYRGIAFFKDQGLRIDHFFADLAVVGRATACEIQRDERKGKDASDHAPVVMTLA